jgi:hypothetical protein
MRKCVIMIAVLAALITLAEMSSAVTVPSKPHFAAPETYAGGLPPGGYVIDFESLLSHFGSS